MPKKKMGQFEKWFWITIGVLFLVWILLQVGATSKKIEAPEGSPATVADMIIDALRPKENLEKNKQIIDDDINLKLSGLNRVIDAEVDKVFAPAYSNIDSFLDYHYSVAGEYKMLWSFAKMTAKDWWYGSDSQEAKEEQETAIRKLNDMIYGSDFSNNLLQAYKNSNSEYEKYFDEHFGIIRNVALNGIDTNLNAEILKNVFNKLNGEISQRFQAQYSNAMAAFGVAGGVALGVKGAKMMAKKGAAKAAAKAGGKLATKATTAGAAASGGVVCGPFAPVCAVGLGVAAWFATDAVVAAGDEHFNRADMRAQVVQSIDAEKRAVAEGLKQSFYTLFKEQSDAVQETLKATPVKVREKIGE
jgi:hypothetical protein